MKTFKHFLGLIAFFIPALSFSGGVTVGNGGDSVAQEFTLMAQEIVKYLPYLEGPELSTASKQALAAAVAKVLVQTKDVLNLRGAEVDAINYPQQGRIEVSRSRWNAKLPDIKERHLRLVLHEYLWMAGIDDSEYHVSNPLYPRVMAARRKFLSASGTMRCFVLVFRAHDLFQDSGDSPASRGVLEFKLKTDGSAEAQVMTNGELVTGSIWRNGSGDVYNILFKLGSSPRSVVTDILIPDGAPTEWDLPGKTRYGLSQAPVGTFRMSETFIEVLKKTNKLAGAPYQGQNRFPLPNVSLMTKDIVSLIKDGSLKSTDIVGLGTWPSCTLGK